MPNPEASLIVPIFNGLRFLPSFWDSLLKSIEHPAFELIIIDDASKEPVLSTLPPLPPALRTTILSNPSRQGYASSVNRGMEQASGSYIVHLNTDLILQPDTIRNLLNTLREHPRAGIVGAKLIYPQTGLIQHLGMAFSDCNKFHFFHHLPATHPLASKSRQVQASTGAVLCVRKELYDCLGPMDESLFNCNEDIDYCLRAQRAGYNIYVDARALAHHWESQSGSARFVRAIENEAIFWGKWFNSISPDISHYIREGLESALCRSEAPDPEQCAIINLSKGKGDRYILDILSQISLVPQPHPIADFLQLNNSANSYWLPMILPLSLLATTRPFIYIVDGYLSLAQNHYWFQKRLQLVGEELIVDHTGCVLLTSDLLSIGSTARIISETNL